MKKILIELQIDWEGYEDVSDELIVEDAIEAKVEGVGWTLLRQPPVSGQSEQCNHVFQRVERGGEFQGNQCECGEWEDLT